MSVFLAYLHGKKIALFSANSAVYVIMWKKMSDPDRPQIIQYEAHALHAE
jgi:hypothetical protein